MMKRKIKVFFIKSIEVINWLERPGFLGMKRAGNIFFGMLLFVGMVLDYFQDSNPVLEKLFMGLLMVVFFSILLILSPRYYLIKLPIISRGTDSPAELFNRFCHWSFIYGILIFAFVESFFVCGILLGLTQIFPNLIFDFSKLFINLFFIIVALFSIFYFMYHLVMIDIPIKVVRARVQLYIAISTTVSAGFFGLSLKEVLLPFVAYLGIAFTWLLFCIEKIDSETEFETSLECRKENIGS